MGHNEEKRNNIHLGWKHIYRGRHIHVHHLNRSWTEWKNKMIKNRENKRNIDAIHTVCNGSFRMLDLSIVHDGNVKMRTCLRFNYNNMGPKYAGLSWSAMDRRNQHFVRLRFMVNKPEMSFEMVSYRIGRGGAFIIRCRCCRHGHDILSNQLRREYTYTQNKFWIGELRDGYNVAK